MHVTSSLGIATLLATLLSVVGCSGSDAASSGTSDGANAGESGGDGAGSASGGASGGGAAGGDGGAGTSPDGSTATSGCHESLDPTFGNGGRATSSVLVSGMHVDSDGSFVVTTLSGSAGSIARLHSDGSPDTSFGTGGSTTLSLAAERLMRQVDGKYLVGEHLGGSIARVDANGHIDTSFGTLGYVRATSSTVFPLPCALRSDGTIVTCGNDDSHHWIVGELSSAGVAVGSFGTSGVTETSFGTVTGSTYASAVFGLVQSSGKILLGGYSGDLGGQATLARYASTGTLDTSFGTNGSILAASQRTSVMGLVGTSGDRFVAAYRIGTSALTYDLVGYAADGALDPSFRASTGIEGTLYGLLAAGDRVVAYGIDQRAGATTFSLFVDLYGADGAPVTSFGDAGRMWLDPAVDEIIGATSSVALDSDGKLVLADLVRISTDGSSAYRTDLFRICL